MFGAFALFRSLGRGVARLVRALENRRAAKALMHLDARNLADIGLTRAAVESVFANTSALEDPSPQLSRIATRFGHAPKGRESAASDQEADKRWPDALPSVQPARLA